MPSLPWHIRISHYCPQESKACLLYCVKKMHVACEIKRYCLNYKDGKLVNRPLPIFLLANIHVLIAIIILIALMKKATVA